MTINKEIIVDTEIIDDLKKQFNVFTETISRRATALAKRAEIKEKQASIRAEQLELENSLKNTATDLSKSLMDGGDLSFKPQTPAREQLAEYKQQLSLLEQTDTKLRDEILILPERDLCEWNLDKARSAYLKSAARSALKNQQQDGVLAVACLLYYATYSKEVPECLADCFGADAVQTAQKNIEQRLIADSGVGECFA